MMAAIRDHCLGANLAAVEQHPFLINIVQAFKKQLQFINQCKKVAF